jgi:hypothetical protein
LHVSWNDVRGSVLDYARAELLSWAPEEDIDLITKVRDLKAECRRRGLRTSGPKPDLADAIASHAEKNPGGFKNEDVQDKVENSEFGFGKELPALPRFFSEAKSNSARMAAAVTEDDDDDADEPSDNAQMGDL